MRFDTVQFHRLLKFAVRQLRQALSLPADADVGFDIVVPRREIVIAQRPIHAESIFGEGGALQLAKDYQVSLLGSLPLHRDVREHIDAGTPTVIKDPTGSLTTAYLALANKVGAALWKNNLQAAAAPLIHIVD